MLKDRLNQDLKSALLGGDKMRASTLRSLKSAILYAEVAQGARDTGLSDQEIVIVLGKEAKKRQESADLFKQAGDEERAAAELAEKTIIETYLPEQLSEQELKSVVNEVVLELGTEGQQSMGQLIAAVKQKVGGSAEGSRIAAMVKERLLK